MLGTLGYMSPEQVRGKPADARSDIFSFGAILYEMLSGKRAFHGDSAADTMSAILKEDPPDLSVTNQNISPGLERIVRHCLEKNPDLRFQSARDLAFNLEALSGTSAQSLAPAGRPGAPPPRRGSRSAPLAASPRRSRPAVCSGSRQRRSQPTYQRITFRRGNIGNARFAPDGKTVVYGASWEGLPSRSTRRGREAPSRRRSATRTRHSYAVSSTGELAAVPARGASSPAATASARSPARRWAADRRARSSNSWSMPTGRPTGRTSRSSGSPRGRTGSSFRSARSSTRTRGRSFASGSRRRAIASPSWSTGAGRLVSSWISPERSRRSRRACARISTGLGAIRKRDLARRPQRRRRGPPPAVDLAGKPAILARAPGRLIPYDVTADGRVLVEAAVSRRRVVVPGAGRDEGARAVLVRLDGAGRAVGRRPDGRASTKGRRDARRRVLSARVTDGSPAVKLGDGDAEDLSPDGKWVLVRRNNAKEIALVPTGTGNAVPSPQGDSSGRRVIFTDDGKSVLMAARGSDGRRAFYLQDDPERKSRASSSRARATPARRCRPTAVGS